MKKIGLVVLFAFLIVLVGGFVFGEVNSHVTNKEALLEVKQRLLADGYVISEFDFYPSDNKPLEKLVTVTDYVVFSDMVPANMTLYTRLNVASGYVAWFNDSYTAVLYAPEFRNISWWLWSIQLG
ncbi:MAG: hypothetical protein LBQ98_07020 [Nitrososphaerota archaeon]|jgi:hypothetical protein|nr:hypothetical protein [Nitrososphaerota archaeon]